MTYKGLITDIDGTLLHDVDSPISCYTKEQLIKALNKNKIVIFATGRIYSGLNDIIKQLDLKKYPNCYAIVCNGAQIFRIYDDKLIYEKAFSVNQLKRIYQQISKYGLNMMIDQNDVILMSNYDEAVYDDFKRVTKNFLWPHDYISEIKYPATKCVLTKSVAILNQVAKDVKNDLNDEFTVNFSNPEYLDISLKDVDKQDALVYLLNQLDLTNEEIIACGDGQNDIKMLEAAKLSFSMYDSRDNVAEHASFVLPDLKNDSVGYIIENYLLK